MGLFLVGRKGRAAHVKDRVARAAVEALESRQLLSAVALWHFNESAGTTAADASGNNHAATPQLGASFAPARGGSALQLDGTSGYAGVANDGSFDLTGQVSVYAG